ncbi:MAG: adenylate/guanylate cyclase domain-containing protein [Hyphomicrobiaceae bacterium]
MNVLIRGDLLQRLRLSSGLILLTFVAAHFLNHALGLVSLEAMLEVQIWRTALTRSWLGTSVLLAAVAIHVGLALWKLAHRSTYRMPLWEATQIATGLLVPPLLLQHVVYNRGAALLAGTRDDYRYELANLWPSLAWDQTALLVLVWVHACVGVHYWLRLTPVWRRLQPLALAVAVALPILALAGFSVAGRQVASELAASAQARPHLMQNHGAPSAEIAARLESFKRWSQYGFMALALAALAAPWGRARLQRLRAPLAVSYVQGPTVRSHHGPTLLEISRMHRVPHHSVCGGRARCSTCRVRVADLGYDLPPPRPAEEATLRSVGAGPGVRLACQLRPPADLTVERVVRTGPRSAKAATTDQDRGVERTVAVLFFDLREFTAITDRKLPYDVVFLLNHLFAAAAAVVEKEGGRIDKYLGDGFMAIFGVDCDPQTACRGAVRAARGLDLAVDTVSRELASETGRPLRCGMGIHVGRLVIGRIGGPLSAELTVIGRPVNVASRLESMCKETGSQLVVSRQALRLAGVPLEGLPIVSVDIRGVSKPVKVALVKRARDLRVTS